MTKGIKRKKKLQLKQEMQSHNHAKPTTSYLVIADPILT